MTAPAWAARLAHLIPAQTGEDIARAVELHAQQKRSGTITVVLDCDREGVCHEGTVTHTTKSRKVTAVP